MVSSAHIMMLGIIPGAALMLAALNPYEGMFEDRRVFSAFAMGIVGGAFMAMFHAMLDGWALLNILTSIAVFVVLFAAVQMMMLVALLNRRGIRQKHDAMFSGVGIGAGAGSFVVVFLNYQILLEASSSIGLADVVTIILLSSSYTMIFSAAGIFAGMFAYRQEKDIIFTGMGMFCLHSLVIMPFRWGWLQAGTRFASLLASTVLALILFLFAYTSIQANLPPEIEKGIRRASRKEKRALEQ